jgi:hypothetical protein
MIKKQFTLYLENRPGVLARVTRTLAASSVNIEGISVAATTDVGLVQIVVNNAAATRRELHALKVAFTVQDVVLVPLRNRPGSLSQVVSKLARKKINLNYVYATACDCKNGCNCYAIISAPDLAGVEAALKAT